MVINFIKSYYNSCMFASLLLNYCGKMMQFANSVTGIKYGRVARGDMTPIPTAPFNLLLTCWRLKCKPAWSATDDHSCMYVSGVMQLYSRSASWNQSAHYMLTVFSFLWGNRVAYIICCIIHVTLDRSGTAELHTSSFSLYFHNSDWTHHTASDFPETK